MGTIVRIWAVVLLFATQTAYAATAFSLQYPIDQTYVPGSYANRVFFAGKDHLGEDISLVEGTVVKAIGNGKLVEYRPSTGYGELVAVIEHDLDRDYAFINAYGNIVVTRKILSIYGHIRDRKNRGDKEALRWKVGDDVQKGDVIGYINNSSHPDGQSPDPNGDGLEHLHLGIRLQGQSAAQAADSQGWFRGYEKATDQGKYFGSADAVIQIVRDKGIQELCAFRSKSSGAAICWVPRLPSDVRCAQAKSWTVYHSYTHVVRVSTNEYCSATDEVFAHYGDGMPAGPLGGGGSSSFNLKLDFDILDSLSDIEWQAGTHPLRASQTVRLQAEAEAKGGDVRHFMRQGKEKIEVDFYVRLDDADWTKLSREYIKADNLRDGKKIEKVLYTIPPGVAQVSFKVKLDAEDEVYESNEGDNWSRIETFDVTGDPPTVNLTVAHLEVPGSVPAGGEYQVRFALRNTGNSLPVGDIRSTYQIRGPGTNNLWLTQTDDGTDRDDLRPGKLHWEETKIKLRVPTVPGQYEQRVCTDVYQSISETNEGDNCLSRFILVTAPPHARPPHHLRRHR